MGARGPRAGVFAPASRRGRWAVSAGSDAGARRAPTLCQTLNLSEPGCLVRGAGRSRGSV